MILDDFDSRPGSAPSLLRTVIGSYLRELGGWISVSELIRLMGALGVSPQQTRTAVTRVKGKGVLVSEQVNGVRGYRLADDAIPMLENGDRRIFSFRQQEDGGEWCLVSFSLPETARATRHQLRRRLEWIGCGTVTTGLWIGPAFLAEEVERILADLDIRDHATVFITKTPQTAESLPHAVAQWWDLERIAQLHRAFLNDAAGFANRDGGNSPELAFSGYIRTLDSWRTIPYLDPGLQPRALPEDWPGVASVALFQHIRRDLGPAASAFVSPEARQPLVRS
ncbi:PaaX family transcriptional regulator [Demequina aurantiaca]|uniref:PaaX family transcriptional regulator n=1 Tax=Demequina aurantiaca TaxID=676200 RepID=UPI0007808A1E|nr:PaaX family transcriptional regulator C-terminal domain-containing protein [Demequina aurantiaca]